MDYDEILQHADPGPEIKEKFFQTYIAPLLKDVKSTKHLPYFFHQGYSAWRLSIKKEDLKQVKFIEWICEELKKTNEVQFIDVLSSVMAQLYDVGVRTEQGERNLYNSQVRGDKQMEFSDQVRFYKILFENEFRLHSTIPYLYVCQVYGIKHRVTDASSFVNVGASEKYHTIKDIQVPLLKGDISKFVAGFDNQIRNAGEGHDRWEVTDKDTLILPIVEPATGDEKKRIELTEKELDDLIKQCRKTIWILKMGYVIFLENNKDFEKKLKNKPVVKLREVEEQVKQFADNRWFDIKKFEVSENKSQILLAIKYRPRVIGTKTQVFFGGGEAYDLIERETFVEYEYQMLDILKMALGCLGGENLPRVIVEMFDEKDTSLGVVEYESDELTKLFIEEGEVQIPQPSKGAAPKVKCRLVYFIKVPYGMREIAEKMLNELAKNKEK